MSGQIATTATPFANGVTAVAGNGATWRFELRGTWATRELYGVVLTDAVTGRSERWGSGMVTGVHPTYLFTYKSKVYALAGDTAYYCDFLGDPTIWNRTNAVGASFIAMSNQFGAAEDVVALSNFQSGLAFLSRNTSQLWDVDPLPANYNQRQVLRAVGTCAPLSVEAMGDADVYFLSDSGVRSLRVRVATNNAVVTDVGSPIQKLLKAILQGLTDTEKAGARAVIEPELNIYWCYIPEAGTTGKIWVFGYFQESEVAGWTKYSPGYETTLVAGTEHFNGGGIYSVTGLVVGRKYYWDPNGNAWTITSGTTSVTAAGVFVPQSTGATISGNPGASLNGAKLYGQVAFTPEWMLVHNGRVYVRSGDTFYLYGGADNQTYDACWPQGDTPFFSAQSPGTMKSYNGVGLVAEGYWRVSVGAKPSDADAVKTAYVGQDDTLERGKSLVALQGTHFKLRFEELSRGYALLSSAMLHYTGGAEK